MYCTHQEYGTFHILLRTECDNESVQSHNLNLNREPIAVGGPNEQLLCSKQSKQKCMDSISGIITSSDNIHDLRIPKLFGLPLILSFLVALCWRDIVELTAQQFHQRACRRPHTGIAWTRSEGDRNTLKGALKKSAGAW
jgi:hypothetical protein